MQIDVNLNINEKLKELNVEKVENPIARGWVEIDGAIKFPVRVMKYTDKEDDKVKMFVSLPQKKNGDKYDDIVKPVNDEIRNEVQNAVLAKLSENLSKNVILTSNVTDVKVNLLKEPVQTGSVKLLAMATITLCGFHISGIQIKEGNRGMFVQMPQHKSGDTYQDTVYGTTALVQQEISEKVLEVFEKVQKEKKVKEKSENVPNFGTEADSQNIDLESETSQPSPVIPNTAPKRHRLV